MKTKGKIGIIVMKPHWGELNNIFYSRIEEEIRHFGYTPEILHYDKFFIEIKKSLKFYYDEKNFKVNDYKMFFLTLFGSVNNFFLAEALLSAGANIKNSLAAINNANDKAKTHLLLSRDGIKTLSAYMNFSQYDWRPLFSAISDDKYIVKVRNGSWGAGVSRVDSKMSLISTQELMASSGIDTSALIFQKYYEETAGTDMRVIVAGKKIVAAMERRSKGMDFRANLFGGGKAIKIEPSEKIKKMAIQAIKVLGLNYGGVDILKTKQGPMVLEVNANPGLKIEEYTGVNVARGIVKELLKD
ncbi:MAG: RimK family alpha-L-glutamate ligase [Patescibacteria group bacterium]|nr:RimK family alpha-L-glutamate ligase [Patescibacteria group bacterium]